MDPVRARHRQGAVTVVDGVPLPDMQSTLSLLPLSVVGQWLAENADKVGGRILDLGAGNQPYRVWYEPLTTSQLAVDVTPSEGLDVLSMSAPLPFQAEVFDTVLCTSVLEHTDDPEQTIAEITRTLRPGGHLLITVPFLYPTHEAPYDFWRVTHYGLRRILERHGLQVESVAAQGGPLLLVAHYLLGGLGQAISRAGAIPGVGRFIDSKLVRWLVAAPQQLLRRLTGPRLSAPARAASLGYMAVAVKPA